MPSDPEQIVTNINFQKCALFLGPNVAMNHVGTLLQTGLEKYLSNQSISVQYDAENFIICKKQTINTIYAPMRQYYETNNGPHQIHKQISQIPFHLIISITPDLLLKHAFDDNGMDYEFSYYCKDRPARGVEEPTNTSPLIYNLFGCIEDQESLVLSHDDILEFLFSIIKTYELPENLRQAIETVTHYVFLGFDFERWYLKILLKIFNLTKEKPSISAEKCNTCEEHRNFFSNIYEMEFIDTNIGKYIDELYKICQKRNILKPIKEVPPLKVKTELINLIKLDKIEETIDKLEGILVNSNTKELYMEVLNLSARHTTTVKQIRNKMITGNEYDVEITKIRNALLNYVHLVEA